MNKLLIFIGLAFLGWGCSSSFKAAENKFKEGKYNTAIGMFEKVKSETKDEALQAKANYRIGDCYRLSNRLAEAEPFYRDAFKSQSITDLELVYQYAFSLKAAGKYESAEKGFKKYVSEGTDFVKVRRAKEELENLKELAAMTEPNPYITIENCDALNTEAAEYSPILYEGKLVFTSSRTPSEMVYEATGKGFTDLYYYELEKGKNCAGTAQPFNPLINLDGFHEASPTFSRNGKIMIFARSNSGRKRDLVTDVKLYYSRLENDEWTEPEVLFPISDPNSRSWDACPTLSADGTTLYFASNRPGGYGGVDIWRSRLGNDGSWTTPQNMGKDINTVGNEMFPYVSREGKLYFASDGHPGLGALDIFEATRRDGKVKIKNLGNPINSSSDDFAMTFVTNKTGYFASNRATQGAKGDDDIYYFVDDTPETKIVNYYLAGTTFSEEDVTRRILKTVELELQSEAGEVLATAVSDSVGRFKFDRKLDIGLDYTVVGVKSDYIKKVQGFSTIGKGVEQEELEKPVTDIVFETELTLYRNIFAGLEGGGLDDPNNPGKTVVLEGILYDFDDWRIRPDAARELDKLVEYLKSRPSIMVELGSHTDNRGRDAYNMKLSKRRADSAVEYIVSQGIEATRIVAKGYGESQLLIPDALSEEEHEKNRRTTVTIIGEAPSN